MPQKRENLEEQIMEDPVIAGLKSIYYSHQSIQDMQLEKYIDHRKITQADLQLRTYLQKQEQKTGKQIPEEEKLKYIYHGVANLVASGGAFNESGNKILFEKSLEELAQRGSRGIRRGQAKELLKGQEYLDNTLKAFGELYKIFGGEQAAQKMPEIYQAIGTISQAGALNEALNILWKHNMLDDKMYKKLKYNVVEKVKIAEKNTKESLVKYSKNLGSDNSHEYPIPHANDPSRKLKYHENESREEYQHSQESQQEQRKYKKVASFFLLLGIALIVFSSFTLTGNVVGSSLNLNPQAGFISAIFFLIASLLLFRKKRIVFGN